MKLTKELEEKFFNLIKDEPDSQKAGEKLLEHLREEYNDDPLFIIEVLVKIAERYKAQKPSLKNAVSQKLFEEITKELSETSTKMVVNQENPDNFIYIICGRKCDAGEIVEHSAEGNMTTIVKGREGALKFALVHLAKENDTLKEEIIAAGQHLKDSSPTSFTTESMIADVLERRNKDFETILNKIINNTL